VAFAKLAAGDDFGLEFVVISEIEVLADTDFAAGANEALPLIGIVLQLAREEDLNLSAEKIVSRRVPGADGLRLKTFAPSIEPGWKHACVVEDDEIVRAEQIGKFSELTIGDGTGQAGEMQQTRSSTVGQRLLSN
jgi:hypothetical protein